MLKNRLSAVLLFAAAILAGCSSTPRQNVMLDQARADYVAAQNTPDVTRLAAAELKEAGIALDQANAAQANREDDEKITQLAYVAKQRIATAGSAIMLPASAPTICTPSTRSVLASAIIFTKPSVC